MATTVPLALGENGSKIAYFSHSACCTAHSAPPKSLLVAAPANKTNLWTFNLKATMFLPKLDWVRCVYGGGVDRGVCVVVRFNRGMG